MDLFFRRPKKILENSFEEYHNPLPGCNRQRPKANGYLLKAVSQLLYHIQADSAQMQNNDQ